MITGYLSGFEISKRECVKLLTYTLCSTVKETTFSKFYLKIDQFDSQAQCLVVIYSTTHTHTPAKLFTTTYFQGVKVTHDTVLSHTPNLTDLMIEAVQVLRMLMQNLVVLHHKCSPNLHSPNKQNKKTHKSNHTNKQTNKNHMRGE